ncbi:MAG: LLM class flavin-dependent oxidoreductase [Chloroflexi bacterium]|nr:LLM class flavin-dependent oxidoreductase [Chloroflexota bacterium]
MRLRFGTYHTFQHPPWISEPDVFRYEMDRLELAEKMGYDEVWIPE